jgi:hypothetical protein
VDDVGVKHPKKPRESEDDGRVELEMLLYNVEAVGTFEVARERRVVRKGTHMHLEQPGIESLRKLDDLSLGATKFEVADYFDDDSPAMLPSRTADEAGRCRTKGAYCHVLLAR